MKPHRRPFQVEIKRGTSRSAFMSPNQSPDVFRKAEAQLFGTKERADADPTANPFNEATPSRRILQAIEEPQPPLLPSSYEPPAPRGRRSGSRNRPKPSIEDAQDDPVNQASVIVTPKRRGRPPGSKKRVRPIDLPGRAESPSLTLAAAEDHAFNDMGSLSLSDLGVVPKRRGRPLGSKNKPKPSEHVATIPRKTLEALDAVGISPDDLLPVESTHASGVEPGMGEGVQTLAPRSASQVPRQRLGHRSKILRRYVWGTEAKPGEKRLGR